MDWSVVEQVARLHGHASSDEEFWIEVVEETGDVDDLQVSVVWVVIVAGKGKGFGGLCHVWSRSDVEEEENEVCGEGKVVGNESVQMVDGIVILESWIVVGVMAMLVDVGWQLAESKPC